VMHAPLPPAGLPDWRRAGPFALREDG